VTWGRLDDKFHSHPKRFLCGLAGDGLLARGISYACDHLTDGFLPEAWVYAQVPGTKRKPDSEGIVAALVSAGVFEIVPSGDTFWAPPDGAYVGPGFVIHDFLDSNPTRAKVHEEREKAAERMQRLRGSGAGGSGSVRPNTSRSSTSPDPSPRPKEKKTSSNEEVRARAIEETPEALRPFIAPVGQALRRVAAEKAGAAEPTVPAVCKALRDYPGRDFLPAVKAFEHHWLHGTAAKKPLRDVVRAYRNWIEREPDVLRKTLPDGQRTERPDTTERNLAVALGEA